MLYVRLRPFDYCISGEGVHKVSKFSMLCRLPSISSVVYSMLAWQDAGGSWQSSVTRGGNSSYYYCRGVHGMVAVQSPFACSRARLRCATSDGASGALDRSEAETEEAPIANLHAC